jgi:hypothetical protein
MKKHFLIMGKMTPRLSRIMEKYIRVFAVLAAGLKRRANVLLMTGIIIWEH